MIIITGSSRGIGKYLMRKFLIDHKDVIGLYKTTKPEDKNRELFFKVDISDSYEVQLFIETVRGRLDNIVLINCASSNYNVFAHKADPLKWANLITNNLVGTFNMINALLPIMRAQEYGRIINLSSVVAQIGVPGTSAYAASKSGLWGMTKAISIENVLKGITINNLNLGYFAIGMTEELPEAIKDEIKTKIPGKKFGAPDEIYKAINYLVSADYITGTSIDINNGLY